jgi:alanyl-tRNA synthetase
VEDTKKNHDGIYMHIGTVTEGAFAVDNKVELAIDAERRRAIARNHSALHLLQAALRQVLGTHVEQAGSYVDEQRGRLDFTHFSAMTAEELAKVEALVNGAMMNAIPVSVELMSIDDARKSGAMALFGVKYGDTVRVVSMGDFSKELCGGTHLTNTGMAGLFRIASESSVAAGVRRIECVTGYNVIAMLDQKDQTIRNIAETIKSSVNDVEVRAQALTAEVKQAQRDVEALNAKLASSKLDAIINSAVTVGNVRVASAAFTDLSVDSVRTMGEMIKDKYADMVAVLAVVGADKLNFVCACGKQANASGALAGNVVRKVAELCGGKGGGRPDVALAGGKDADKVPEALGELPAIVEGMLK